MPTLRADRLVAGFLYWDARADDCAAHAHASCARPCSTTAPRRPTTPGDRTDDRCTGAGCGVPPSRPTGPSRSRSVPTVVVNAAGVWSDEVRTLDEGHDPHSIRPAKGIHITVPEEAFPCDIAAVIPVKEDKRSIFVVSWGDQVYLGTTDTAWDGPLDDPSCTPEDVDYILGAANAISTRPLTRDDITGVWTGSAPAARPRAEGGLVRADGGPVPAPHGAHLAGRRGDRDRRQAHHLPEDGRGHRRRRHRPARPRAFALPHRRASGSTAPPPAGGWSRRRVAWAPTSVPIPTDPIGSRCRPPGGPLRHRGRRRPGHGRRPPRAARAAGPRTPLPGGGGAVGRAARDGRAPSPTSSTAAPSRRTATPGPRPTPPPSWPRSSVPSSAGTTARCRAEAACLRRPRTGPAGPGRTRPRNGVGPVDTGATTVAGRGGAPGTVEA